MTILLSTWKMNDIDNVYQYGVVDIIRNGVRETVKARRVDLLISLQVDGVWQSRHLF